jgi:hypothetical protein
MVPVILAYLKSLAFTVCIVRRKTAGQIVRQADRKARRLTWYIGPAGNRGTCKLRGGHKIRHPGVRSPKRQKRRADVFGKESGPLA